MKNYELTYLISPGLSEEERKNLCQRVISALGVQPETREESPSWTSFNFLAEPEKIKDIEQKLKDGTLIKRYLILAKKPRKLKIKFAGESVPQKTTERPKVELKEIEKKLDEILK